MTSPAKEDDDETAGVFAVSAKFPEGSGASSHMTREKKLLTNYKEFDIPQRVSLGDGHSVNAVGAGNVSIQPKINVMHEVLYVPELTCNLFSVRAAAVRGNTVNFGFDKCWIREVYGVLVYLRVKCMSWNARA